MKVHYPKKLLALLVGVLVTAAGATAAVQLAGASAASAVLTTNPALPALPPIPTAGGDPTSDPVGDCAASLESSVSVSPSTVLPGEPVTVTWSSSSKCGAVTSMSGPGFDDGAVAHSGSRQVVPTAYGANTWRLTLHVGVYNLNKTVSASAFRKGLYFYGGAFQNAFATGAAGNFTAYSTQLADADPVHTTVQLSVASADGKQLVEMGLTVDNELNGSTSIPYLFIDQRVDGVETCFNTCGFVPLAGAHIAPHTGAYPGSVHRLSIEHRDGAWWLADTWRVTPTSTWTNGGNLGYYPDSLWGGRFTHADTTQWFGEVFANTQTPCTDMGNGQFPSATSAVIDGLTVIGSPLNLSLNQSSNTHPSYYNVGFTPDDKGITYGGPGAC
jgi:hypothetical protein